MIWDLEKEFPVTQMMNRDGKLIDGSYEDLIDETLVQTFYRQLVCMRAFDQKVINLQRQGRIGTYPGFERQEAAQGGSALALREDDRMIPKYRGHAARMKFGNDYSK